MTESARLADQIRRAFEGDAWHGDPLLKILKDVDSQLAAARPIPNAHSIWELVLHIRAWDDVVRRRTSGAVRLNTKENFPQIKDISEAAWKSTLKVLRATHNDLVKTVESFPASRLHEQVPGKKQNYYNFYFMFSGIAQHELYHAGQIALLKKFR